jgi:hypoxanthine phosphoribosyltransferase
MKRRSMKNEKEQHEHIEEILITETQIKSRLIEIGTQITNDFLNSKESLVIIALLKGAAVFAADLIRNIDLPLELDFIIATSYGDGMKSSKEVRIIQDVQIPIRNKNVVIVDDIIDTGFTLSKIIQILEAKGPKEIKICTLLDKKETRENRVPIDYFGFEVPNKFVVGYGMDFGQYYRNLPYIGILKTSSKP